MQLYTSRKSFRYSQKKPCSNHSLNEPETRRSVDDPVTHEEVSSRDDRKADRPSNASESPKRSTTRMAKLIVTTLAWCSSDTRSEREWITPRPTPRSFVTVHCDTCQPWEPNTITEFLQGDLEKEICFVKLGEHRLVCYLNKSIDPHLKLDDALKKLGLIQSELDPCLHYSGSKVGKVLFMEVYVNDVMVFTNEVVLKSNLKTKRCSIFRMKNLGSAVSCLDQETVHRFHAAAVQHARCEGCANSSEYRRKSIEGNVPENFGRDGADDEIRVSGGRWMLTSFATTKGQRRQD